MRKTHEINGSNLDLSIKIQYRLEGLNFWEEELPVQDDFIRQDALYRADQLHGFEERLTTYIYPASFAWTPDWIRGANITPSTSVKRLLMAGVCQWNGQMANDEEVLYRTLEKVRLLGGTKRERPFFVLPSRIPIAHF